MVNDVFGIKMIYPSDPLNPQRYEFPINASEMQQSFLDNFITHGSFAAFTTTNNNIVRWYEHTPLDGDDAIIIIRSSEYHGVFEHNDVLVPAECDHNLTEAHERGYFTDPDEYHNIEMTSHFFVKTVNKPTGYIFFEARSSNNHPGELGECCSDHGYGVRLFWDTATANKGKFAFYKRSFSGDQVDLPKQTQSPTVIIPSFYQNWFGVKFVIYNTTNNNRVRLELWLTPVNFLAPFDPNFSQRWTKVGEVEDFVGKRWTHFGNECDAISDDAPITWRAPFISFGWKDGKVIQFAYTSFREIDPQGSFGQDPPPPETPPTFPDPTIPDPDPDPPTTPDPQPPDAEPPLTNSTLTRRLTLRREILNNASCRCDGFQGEEPTTPPGGGGGTLVQIYNVPLITTGGFARLATVDGNSGYYLRVGQIASRTSSVWLNKSINRVEITIAKTGNPTGGTGGGIHCRVRKGSDDSIAATLTPVVAENSITTGDGGTVCIFENLTNTYKMQLDDMLLFEYDGGDINNYIRIFRREQETLSGTKVVFQTNTQDPGEYTDEPAIDLCARVWTLTP